jgi:hypothetical protein
MGLDLDQAATLIQMLKEIDFASFGVAYVENSAVLCVRKSEVHEDKSRLIEDFVEQNKLCLTETNGYLMLASKPLEGVLS